MAPQRSHSIEFKRQVAQEFIAGQSLYALSKWRDISRQLVRVWVQKYEAGALDEDAQAADLLQEYEAKIAALERMVARNRVPLHFRQAEQRNHAARAATRESGLNVAFGDELSRQSGHGPSRQRLQAGLRSAHRSGSWRRARKSSPSIRGFRPIRSRPPLPTLQVLIGKCMEWDAPVDEKCSRQGIWTRCHKRKP